MTTITIYLVSSHNVYPWSLIKMKMFEPNIKIMIIERTMRLITNTKLALDCSDKRYTKFQKKKNWKLTHHITMNFSVSNIYFGFRWIHSNKYSVIFFLSKLKIGKIVIFFTYRTFFLRRKGLSFVSHMVGIWLKLLGSSVQYLDSRRLRRPPLPYPFHPEIAKGNF